VVGHLGPHGGEVEDLAAFVTDDAGAVEPAAASRTARRAMDDGAVRALDPAQVMALGAALLSLLPCLGPALGAGQVVPARCVFVSDDGGLEELPECLPSWASSSATLDCNCTSNACSSAFSTWSRAIVASSSSAERAASGAFAFGVLPPSGSVEGEIHDSHTTACSGGGPT
jgi:hypothetical protein